MNIFFRVFYANSHKELDDNGTPVGELKEFKYYIDFYYKVTGFKRIEDKREIVKTILNKIEKPLPIELSTLEGLASYLGIECGARKVIIYEPDEDIGAEWKAS